MKENQGCSTQKDKQGTQRPTEKARQQLHQCGHASKQNRAGSSIKSQQLSRDQQADMHG